jgi:hypothetical protein
VKKIFLTSHFQIELKHTKSDVPWTQRAKAIPPQRFMRSLRGVGSQQASAEDFSGRLSISA